MVACTYEIVKHQTIEVVYRNIKSSELAGKTGLLVILIDLCTKHVFILRLNVHVDFT